MPERGNKERKSERLKDFFAQTAKEMILEKGLESISVRNIAEEAGYSLGTIYNHFENLDELLWRTRNLFFQDIGIYMDDAKQPEPSLKGLVTLFQRYAGYFIDHPQVYRFFYFHHLDRGSKKQPDLLDSPGFQQQRLQGINFLVDSGIYSTEEIPELLNLVIFSIQGLLTLALGDNDEIKTKHISGEIEKIIPWVFQRYKR